MYYNNDMKKRTNIVSNQSGMVAFVVTSFIIIMLSLVVLAFSQNVRREQRQALDRQLSSQAYYTAESAVNETSKYLLDKIASPGGLSTELKRKENCNPLPGSDGDKLLGQDTDGGGTFKYSCVMWKTDPEELHFDALDDQGKTVSLDTGGNLSSVTITWREANSDPEAGVNFSCGSGNNFPTSSAYTCNMGMLRIAILPFKSGGRDNLIDSTFTTFAWPRNDPADPNVSFNLHSAGPEYQGDVNSGGCVNENNDRRCYITITNLPTGKNYLLVKSLYKKSNVVVTGSSGGAPAKFTEGQIMIDATARASDIIKRIKAYIPYREYASVPGYSVQTADGICKTLEVWPTGSSGLTSCN